MGELQAMDALSSEIPTCTNPAIQEPQCWQGAKCITESQSSAEPHRVRLQSFHLGEEEWRRVRPASAAPEACNLPHANRSPAGDHTMGLAVCVGFFGHHGYSCVE